MRLEPRERASPLLMLGASAGAALLALLLCAIPLLWAGAPVLDAYGVMIQGAFGSRFAVAETLSRATPLVLTGLAATVAFRAKLWNIGAEGQLYLGALAAAALGSGALDLPGWALLPLILAAGALAGGLW